MAQAFDSEPDSRPSSENPIHEVHATWHRLYGFVVPKVPVLIAVPHAGRQYSSALMAEMRQPDKAMVRLEDRLVDVIGKALADAGETSFLVADAPRALIDLNRSPEEIDLSMISGVPTELKGRHAQQGRRARGGLGLIPRRIAGLGEIWRSRVAWSEVERRIDKVHAPYHLQLRQELLRIRDEWGAALLLDFHSMPPLGNGAVPRFVLGDRFGTSCDGRLIDWALAHFERNGHFAAHNQPYAGGYILETHADPDRGIHAIQIEICRSLYLEENHSKLRPDWATLLPLLFGLVRGLKQITMRLGEAGRHSLAAE